MKIQIQQILNLDGWKEMTIGDDFEFINIDKCICCKSPLLTLVRQYDKNHNFDLGCCDNCGFVTYKTKPSHKWILNFYENTWNEGEGDNKEFVNTKLSKSKLTDILNEINFPKDKSICEIGTGRGGNFAALINNGYKNLIGIENSIHRAKLVNKSFPELPIYIGGFEQDSVQNSLRQHDKFDLIYTAHVVEHIYDPEQTIRLCSELQNENGYLIIAVPNFIGEPSFNVTSFLPHLHSFTIESMISLLNNNGYQIINSDYSTDSEVLIIAKKSSKINKTPIKNSHFQNSINKLINEIHYKELSITNDNYFYFSRKDSQDTGIKILSNISLINYLQRLYLNFKFRNSSNRTLIIRKLDNKKDSNSESFLTIIWDKLTLFYK